MCGRLVRDLDEDARRNGFYEFSEKVVPRFNIGPMQSDFLLRASPDDGGRQLVPSWWGLVPSWAKDPKIGTKAFNARSETLLERPMFRGLVGRRRGMVPASGFYEWRRDGSRKQPLYIHRRDRSPLTLAALWDEWTDPTTGERRTSHTIVTTTATGMMAPIHDRMPVVLDGEALQAWLDPAIRTPADILPLLVPCADDLLTAYPVGPEVGNIRNDGPGLIIPVDPAH